MKKIELLLIIEEIEMKILRMRIVLKKSEREVTVVNNFYKTNENSAVAPYVQTLLKKRKIEQHDAEIIIAEMLQSKFYYQQLLKKN